MPIFGFRENGGYINVTIDSFDKVETDTVFLQDGRNAVFQSAFSKYVNELVHKCLHIRIRDPDAKLCIADPAHFINQADTLVVVVCAT